MLKLPDPPTLAFLGEKTRETPKKTRVFSFAEPQKSLDVGEKRKKTHKTSQESRKTKKTSKKNKGWRVRAFATAVVLTIRTDSLSFFPGKQHPNYDRGSELLSRSELL